MPKILDDIYYFRHPINANCVVFAFLTGNGREFDLIDTGIKKFGIFRTLLKQMRKDGLEPWDVRNVFHTHYHFDHVQCDRLFQQNARRNKNNVVVYAGKPDKYRTKPKFSIIQSNMNYLLAHFQHSAIKSFQLMPFVGKFLLDPFMKTKTPENIKFYEDQDEFLIGKYKAKVYLTGGHTEGHSFFYFPEIKALHTGDNNALNEFIVDFSAVIRSMQIARDLNPDMIFIGHNEPKTEKQDAYNWINTWFREFEGISDMLIPLIRNDVRINITKIMKAMAGWTFKVEVIRFFAFMQLYVILHYLEMKKYGKIELGKNDFTLYFHTAPNVEDINVEFIPNNF
ncbi:MAG: MBL fold metallo-hydrolase [Candidatus Lokiarchaeota archaeon]|nr:MBL fold metallo-hydrolase [Candidatus Lokiarchaeota archaeon]